LARTARYGVREDIFRIIRYTSYWILYGFIALVAISSIAAAIQGAGQP
jgi:hypothetical protein